MKGIIKEIIREMDSMGEPLSIRDESLIEGGILKYQKAIAAELDEVYEWWINEPTGLSTWHYQLKKRFGLEEKK